MSAPNCTISIMFSIIACTIGLYLYMDLHWNILFSILTILPIFAFGIWLDCWLCGKLFKK